MTTSSCLLACLSSLALAGCGSALGQSITADECAPGKACESRGFNAPVAVGATIRPRAQIELRASAASLIRYESAAPDLLAVDKEAVTARDEGVAALFFLSQTGEVLDFVHVWTKKADGLRVRARTEADADYRQVMGPMEVLRGESVRIRVRPTAEGQDLEGSAPATWKADANVLSILEEGEHDTRRLVARAPGKTTLTVSMLGVETNVELVVVDLAAQKAGAL